MSKASPDDIAKAKAANPGVEIHITSHPLPGGEVQEFLVKAPSRGTWDIFRAQQADPVEKMRCEQTLFDACVLWPEDAERLRIIERYPALPAMSAGELGEIAGASRGGSHRKA